MAKPLTIEYSGGLYPVMARGDPRDVLGRITSVATTVNGAAVTLAGNRSFRPDGLLLGQNFGNGVNELRTYDTQGQLKYQSLASADTIRIISARRATRREAKIYAQGI